MIPHPKIDEKSVATISEHDVSELLRYIDYHRYGSEKQRFRATRDRALIPLFWDIPGCRAELVGLTMGYVDLDSMGILVMGMVGLFAGLPSQNHPGYRHRLEGD